MAWSARRLVVAAVVGGAIVGTVGGCGSTGLSQARLDTAISRTFANLWILQQTEQGHPHPRTDALRSRAACVKGSPSVPQHGAGSDWVCSIVWLVDGPATSVTALYNLNLRTNGCYTADGDGPVAVNGSRTVTTAAGTIAINPLWSFDGCFDPA